MNTTQLRDYINLYIKTNDNAEISGSKLNYVLGQFIDNIEAGFSSNIPVGGTYGSLLFKNSSTNYDATWSSNLIWDNANSKLQVNGKIQVGSSAMLSYVKVQVDGQLRILSDNTNNPFLIQNNNGLSDLFRVETNGRVIAGYSGVLGTGFGHTFASPYNNNTDVAFTVGNYNLTQSRFEIGNNGNFKIGQLASGWEFGYNGVGFYTYNGRGMYIGSDTTTSDWISYVKLQVNGQTRIKPDGTNPSIVIRNSANTNTVITIEDFSIYATTQKKVLGIQSYAETGLRYLTMNSSDNLYWGHRLELGGLLKLNGGLQCVVSNIDFNASNIQNLFKMNMISDASIIMRPDFNLAVVENNLGLFIAPNNTANPTKKLIKLMDSTLTNTYFAVNGNGQVMLGTSSPNSSALIQIDSTTKGALFPRGTYANMTSITGPVNGLEFTVTESGSNWGKWMYSTHDNQWHKINNL